MAYYLGKKAEEFSTHRWVLYVRGPQGEDISTFVEKVSFTLHPSFPNPVREVYSYPFELSETGWGEFQACIRIYFKEKDEQPIDLFHHLKLYPPMSQQPLTQKKPVVAENYDEILFTSPKKEFYQMLMQYGSVSYDATTNNVTQNTLHSSSSMSTNNKTLAANPEYYVEFDDNLDMEALLAIQDHLHKEISDAKMKLVNIESEIVEVFAKRQQELQATVAAAATAANSNAAASASSSNNPTASPQPPPTPTGKVAV